MLTGNNWVDYTAVVGVELVNRGGTLLPTQDQVFARLFACMEWKGAFNMLSARFKLSMACVNKPLEQLCDVELSKWGHSALMIGHAFVPGTCRN